MYKRRNASTTRWQSRLLVDVSSLAPGFTSREKRRDIGLRRFSPINSEIGNFPYFYDDQDVANDLFAVSHLPRYPTFLTEYTKRRQTWNEKQTASRVTEPPLIKVHTDRSSRRSSSHAISVLPREKTTRDRSRLQGKRTITDTFGPRATTSRTSRRRE